jgi:signal transduction histidine kinase/CheY-like chemotaxis protein
VSVVTLTAFAVLGGWFFEIRVLKSIVPHYITMKANTAVCFLLLSAVLYLFKDETRSPLRLQLGSIAAMIVIFISGLTLFEYLLDYNFGIDELFFKDPEGINGHFPPGRLAPITAINFILLSAAFLIGNIPRNPNHKLAQFLTGLAFVASLQGLMGYLINITYLFGSAYYTQMAIHTTICFILICIGSYASRPNKGFIEAFSSNTTSSAMARKLLAAVIFAPIFVRWVAAWGQSANLYDQDFAVLIQVMGNVIIIGTVLISTAQALFKSEKEREEARERAESASRAKTNFLANISHEIRTPLGAVLGFSEILAAEKHSDIEHPELTEAIKRNGEQLLRLIDDLLDISKIEAGHLSIAKKKTNFKEFIDDVVSLAKLKCKEKEISFELRYLSAVPEAITTDSARLRQILLNVIGNAIKFNEKKGSVILSVEFVPAVKPLIRFGVQDTGRGISLEEEQKLFLPFSQGDTSATRRYGGSGLGLALSKKIANALGGDLRFARPQVGKGSYFTIDVDPGAIEEIKLINPEVSQEKQANKPILSIPENVNENLNKIRVLLVEDSVDNQVLVSRFLRSAGAEVELANDGLEGVDKALHGKFDIVLMDLQMPNLDGYQAIERLRGIGYKVPIVALTAHAFQEDRDRCLKLGFNEHLTKPVNKRQLLHTVEAFTTPLVAR